MVPRRIDEKGEWRIVGPEGHRQRQGRPDQRRPAGRARARSPTATIPSFWAPNWVQGGNRPGGDYPLAEPEAKAVVDFLIAHPNIASVQSYHTHSGAILRPYCNRATRPMPPQDMRTVQGGGCARVPRSPAIRSCRSTTTSRPTSPTRAAACSSTGRTTYFGAFALTTEIWKAPGETGKSAFDTFDENLAMQWNDRELGGKGFVNWTKFKHPQFGEMEIGGWNTQLLQPESAAEVRRGGVEEELPVRDQASRAPA